MSDVQRPHQTVPPTGPDPGHSAAQRIGDAERDRAVNALSEHLASGRLDQSEFDERMAAALHAWTHADLEPLFLDLPEPRPVSTTYSPAAQARPAHPHYTTPARPPHASQVGTWPRPHEGASSPHGRRRRYPFALAPAIWCVAIALVVFSSGHLWWMMPVAVLVSTKMWGGGCGRGRSIDHRTEQDHRTEHDRHRIDT